MTHTAIMAHGSRPIFDPSHCNFSQFLRHIAFVFVLFFASFATAWADVPYIDEDRRPQTCTTYTELTDTTTITWSGWYVASGTVSINERVNVSGTAHLILTDGAALSIPKGIHVLENDSLTIYGQTSGTGTLTINGVEFKYAGIGGGYSQQVGTITINGGTLNVTAGAGSACAIGGGKYANGGTITINGGTVTANGGYSGTGIGTAKEGGDYGNAAITINGGKVSVSGGEYASGIDSGRNVLTLGWTDEDDFIANSKTYKGSTVRVKDGQMLTDNEGNYYSGTLTELNLKGKTLHPVPDAHAITIGTVTGGSVTADRTIARSGETVTLTAGTGYRVVSGKFNEGDITITDGAGTFTMPNETVTITATVEKIPHNITLGSTGGGSVVSDKSTAGIDDTVTLTVTPDEGKMLYDLTASYNDGAEKTIRPSKSVDEKYTFTMPPADVTVSAMFGDSGLVYFDGDGTAKRADTFTSLADSSLTSLSGGWYSAQSDLEISGRVTVTGDVSLVLTDGVTLAIPKGITVEGENKLTIYGQTSGTGTLVINGVEGDCAGIGGGGIGKAGGTITIRGGVVNVTGSDGAAAIGGGWGADGGTITITGGKVTAANSNGTGIGGGVSFAGLAEAAITLGWTRADDFIQTDSDLSYVGTVTLTKNFLLDGTNTVATAENIMFGGKIVPCELVVHEVTFYSNGGSAIDTLKIVDGQTATEPEKPMKQGYKFAGWYADEGLTDAYDFGTAVTGNLTLYAKWAAPEAISYINANGETVSGFTNYTPLEDGYTNLPAGFWYVGENVTTADRIVVNGEVSIILGKGSTLTVSGGIIVTGENTLNIFADSEGSGRLIATGNSYAAIGSAWDFAGGGTTTGSINIYGGQIMATQTDTNGKAIGASYEATSSGTITLGYTHAEDFIEATSYVGAVSVVSGKTFLTDDETPVEISGTVSDLTAIDGKRLTPKGVLDVTVTGGNVIAPEKAFAGQTVTLGYAGEIPAGYEVVYKVNGTAITGNTFTMPEVGAVEVSVTLEKVGFVPQDPDTPEFAYHSLILSGQIGVIFHVYVPEGADEGDYAMYFDVSGDKSQNTQPVSPFETITEDGNTFFGFKCFINSVQMADEIHAVLTYGDNETITETYTAKQYLDSLIADTTQPDDVIALGEAIKDYGCYVQPVLAETNDWEIGKKHASMDAETEYTDADFAEVSDETSDHALNCTIPDDSGIEAMSYALVLDSETAIEIYLDPKDDYAGNVIAHVDGGSSNMAVKRGNEYVVSIGNISAHLLGESHTVTVEAGGQSFNVEISALSYVQSAINDDDPAMKRAVTSLYRYWDATMTYRRNRPNEYHD